MTEKENNLVGRGTFLKGAGGLTIAALMPKEVWAAKKYRVGVIGHTGRGGYGHGLDKVWRDIPQAEIVGVADPDPKGLAKRVNKLGASKGYDDYRKMLDEAKPNLVSIGPTYIDMHCDVVVAAAERGVRGIYMEKPLCPTLEEADRMVDVCRKYNVKLATAHQSLYLPKMKVIQEIIQSGKLGRLLEIRGRCKEDERGGCLGLWVLGTRMLTLMHALAGDPLSCFGTILQDGRPITRQDLRESDDNGVGLLGGNELHAMYRFSSGAIGYFDSVKDAGAQDSSRFGMQIFGSKGVLQWTVTEFLLSHAYFLPDPSWNPGLTGKEWIPVSTAGIGVPEPIQDDGDEHHAGNILAVKDLIVAVEEDRQPVANVEKARTNIEMILAVFESHRVGGMVSLPLKNRKNPLTMLK